MIDPKSKIDYQTLDIKFDDDGARRLADEMQSNGRDALYVEAGRLKRKSLKFLERFTFLRHLVVGGTARDIEVIGELQNLRELNIQAVVPDFGFLARVPSLRLFSMNFGRCPQFETLAAAQNLIGLQLDWLPSLKSIEFVKSMPRLQLLEIEYCKGLTALPDLSNNHELRKLVLMTVNGLSSLRGIETAKRLEVLIVGQANALPPSEFNRVNQCESLRKVLAGIGLISSARYKQAISFVPEPLRLLGYYGGECEGFEWDGDPRK